VSTTVKEINGEAMNGVIEMPPEKNPPSPFAKKMNTLKITAVCPFAKEMNLVIIVSEPVMKAKIQLKLTVSKSVLKVRMPKTAFTSVPKTLKKVPSVTTQFPLPISFLMVYFISILQKKQATFNSALEILDKSALEDLLPHISMMKQLSTKLAKKSNISLTNILKLSLSMNTAPLTRKLSKEPFTKLIADLRIRRKSLKDSGDAFKNLLLFAKISSTTILKNATKTD
jgi:hypothetical protein